MVVVRLLFWTWLAVSVCILGYRLARAVARRGQRMQTSRVGAGVVGGAVDDAPPSSPMPAREAEPQPPPPPRPDPPPVVPPSTPAPAGGRTLAEMVSGIQMPCDLVPVLDAKAPLGAREAVAFCTTGHAADEVGQAVADEVERLGFRVHALATSEILATRGDDELKLAIHANPSAVAYAGQKAFPSARPGQVVLELWRE